MINNYRKVEGFRRNNVWFNEFQSIQDAESFCEYVSEYLSEYNHYFREEDKVIFTFDSHSVYYTAWSNQIIERGTSMLDAWKAWLRKNDPNLETYGIYLNGR